MIALSQTAKTARIRELNDAFRRTFAGGKVTMTAGVYVLPDNSVESTARGWYFGRTSRFGDMHAMSPLNSAQTIRAKSVQNSKIVL